MPSFRLVGLLILSALAVACHQGKSSSNKADSKTGNSLPVAEKPREDPVPALLPATVSRSLKGDLLEGQPTQLLYIDKGTLAGVRKGMKGYRLVHNGAALVEFVVVAATEQRAVLKGWYVEEIASGTELVLDTGGTPSWQIWRYFDPNATQSASNSNGLFTARVYAPYKLGDWLTFSKEVAASTDWQGHADHLLTLAEAASMQGIESLGGGEWSNGDYLRAADFVRFSLAIVAASQGASEPEGAVLSPAQLRKLAGIWDILYNVSLSVVGADNDHEPESLAEPREKLEAAFQIAGWSHDETRMLFSQIGLAWLDCRSRGRFQWEHRTEVENIARAHSLWPPVFRQSGRLAILSPKEDPKPPPDTSRKHK